MDDEYYDRDGHDDGQFFADTEEEAHFSLSSTTSLN